jgi:ubiquitin carboxyl-terminal hydrolase 10
MKVGFVVPSSDATEEAALLDDDDEGEAGKSIDCGPAPLLEPRGITNPGNRCFLNSVLQALLACTPMAAFLSRSGGAKTPLLAVMARFYDEFRRIPSKDLGELRPRICKTAVPPLKYLYDTVLTGFARWTGDGQAALEQQDAQELFTFLIDAMHEELQAKKGTASATKEGEDDSGEWTEVGPGGHKGAVVLSQGDQFGESPISAIFFGRMRSTLRKAGAGIAEGNTRTATIQPFHCLHLDVANPHVRSIEDAVRVLLAPEVIRGCKAEAGSQVVAASKISTFESLPQVLCLHMKRFAFSAGAKGVPTVVKIHKPITYGRSLVVDGITFRLVAVVNHHGDSTARGHYTCDVLHGGRWWLNCNDAKLTWIPRDSDVLLNNKETYMLFYVRQPSRGRSQQQQRCK